MQVLRCTRKNLDSNWVNQEALRITSLLSASKPVRIILFGSAAENKMTDQSDFDFLVVHSTEDAIKNAQKDLRPHYPLSEYPVDIIWLTVAEFEAKRDVGGISFIAAREGKMLFESTGEEHDQIKKV